MFSAHLAVHDILLSEFGKDPSAFVFCGEAMRKQSNGFALYNSLENRPRPKNIMSVKWPPSRAFLARDCRTG